MFKIIDADIYVLVDGDNTYPAEQVHRLLEPILTKKVDMVVGSRIDKHDDSAFRRLHKFGNNMISKIVSCLFSIQIVDVLSGYRIFTKRLAKRLYLRSGGFEIETEITLQSIVKGYSIFEIPIHYKNRPKGSNSKLNTFKDGILIIKTAIMIFKDYKPLLAFSLISLVTFILSITAGIFPILDFIKYQFVYHVPLAILAASLFILSILFFGIGLVLDTIVHFHLDTTSALIDD